MFAGLAAFAPQAEAGQYAKQFRGYDHCGRPIYTYVHKSEIYCAPQYGHRYNNGHHYGHRSNNHNYNAGKFNRGYYSGRDYDRGYSAPAYRYNSGSRFSVNFGF